MEANNKAIAALKAKFESEQRDRDAHHIEENAHLINHKANMESDL